MQLIGMDCDTFQLPVKNMDVTSFEQFKADAQQVGFHTFCSALTKKAEIEGGLMHQQP
jgi:N-acetylneuraminate lyase